MTGVAAGTANITVRTEDGNHTATCTVSVTDSSAQPTAEVGSTITVNGTAVTSGTASVPINLNVGSNTINIVVSDGASTLTTAYAIIVVTRAASSGGSIDGGSSDGGGGGSSSSSDYLINVDQSTGGRVTVQPGRADRGDLVIITVDPNTGYALDALIVRDSSGNLISVAQQSDTRYTFEMPSSRVTIEATFTRISQDHTPSSLPFTDVAASAWYYNAVEYVYERGMMAGVENNLFSPNATTTRAMIVTILYSLENRPSSGSMNFTDVPAGQWYTSPIAWTAANGIVGGYGDGRFGPNDTITREQMAAILYRYAQFKGYDVSNIGDLSRYTHAGQVSDWTRTAIGWANAQGLITGNTATTLNPIGSATRAEVATILIRFVENVAG